MNNDLSNASDDNDKVKLVPGVQEIKFSHRQDFQNTFEHKERRENRVCPSEAEKKLENDYLISI